MKTKDYIIRQLIEQQIEFEIIHDKSLKPSEPELNKVVFAWKNKFIGNEKAPHIDRLLWHIFSYKAAECLEKEAADIELKKQYHADTYIFNGWLQYLIRCKNKIPIELL